MKIKTPFFIIEIEWLFLIVSFLFILSGKVRNYLISFFICYLFIIFHELSHMLIASIFGKNIEKFKFSLSGVNIFIQLPRYDVSLNNKNKKENIKNIMIYFAGPISNFVLAYLFQNIKFILEINICLGILNLFPVYPLDGYQILKNVLEIKAMKYKKIILEMVNIIFILILSLMSIYQILYSKNYSAILFVFYVILIKLVNDKSQKNSEKFTLLRC